MITLEEVNEYSRAIAILLDQYISKEEPLRGKSNYMTLRKPFLDEYRRKDNELHDAILAKMKA